MTQRLSDELDRLATEFFPEDGFDNAAQNRESSLFSLLYAQYEYYLKETHRPGADPDQDADTTALALVENWFGERPLPAAWMPASPEPEDMRPAYGTRRRPGSLATRIGSYAEKVTEMHARPGEWITVAKVPLLEQKSAYNLTHRINAGIGSLFSPRGAFQATTETDPRTELVTVKARIRKDQDDNNAGSSS